MTNCRTASWGDNAITHALTGQKSGKSDTHGIEYSSGARQPDKLQPLRLKPALCHSNTAAEDAMTVEPQVSCLPTVSGDYGNSRGWKWIIICNAPLFVTHNSRETKYWRVKKDKVPG